MKSRGSPANARRNRTPRRDHLARSTPELIVRRLVERAEGAERALFERVLGKFGEG